MERYGTAEDISPREMTAAAVLLFDGMVRQRSLDPQAIPGDLFARVIRRLFTAPATPETGEGSSAP